MKRTNQFPLEIRASKVKQVPANLMMVGDIEVQAADKDQPEARPRFLLMANTGKPMDLDGFYDPVVIDIAGAKFDKKTTPVIMDHDTSKRIGATTEQVIVPNGGEAPLGGRTIKGPMVAASGEVRSKMGVAQGFVEDSRDGFPFQVSVGASIVPGGAEFVGEGEKVEVNGRTFKGPLIVARKTVIRELTVTVLGADNNTSAKVAATSAASNTNLQLKGNEMDFEAYVKSLGLDPATLNDAQREGLKAQWEKNVKAGGTVTLTATNPGNPGTVTDPEDDAEKNRLSRIAAQERRVDGIRAAFTRFPKVKKVTVGENEVTVEDFKASAISNPDRTVDSVELVLMRAERDQNPTSGSGPAIHAVQQVRDMEPDVLTCAVLKTMAKSSPVLKANETHQWTGEKWGIENWYPQQVLEASDHPDLRNVGLHQLMNLQVIAATGQPWIGSDKNDLIAKTRDAMRASSGFTTLNISNIFDDVANKVLLAGYQSINTTWQEWAKAVSVNDFKTHNFYRLTSKGGYQPVGPNGELKHGGFAEDKYQVAADTLGKIYGLDRKHLINDDLGAFESLMSGLGIEGGKTVEELAYVHLLGNVATLFPTDGSKGNYISGAATALSIDGLSAGQQAFEDQTIDNAPILIEPDRILVGTSNRVTAGQLYKDADIRPTGTTAAKNLISNPHQSAFRPIVSGYLNNTSIKQRAVADKAVGTAIPGQSATQWFMMGNPGMPQGAIVMIAFLNGNRTPFLERSDASFDVLGMQWRAYHDIGTGSGEPKLAVHSKGAA